MAMNHMRQKLVEAGLASYHDAMDVESLKRNLEKWERREKKYSKNTSQYRTAKIKVDELREKLNLEENNE